jgi:hypothetical protein
MKKAIASLFSDEKGNMSMKRLCGLFCTVALCVTMYHNSFSPLEQAPSSVLVESVALLAFGCLGLSSVDKFTANKKSNSDTPAE